MYKRIKYKCVYIYAESPREEKYASPDACVVRLTAAPIRPRITTTDDWPRTAAAAYAQLLITYNPFRRLYLRAPFYRACAASSF